MKPSDFWASSEEDKLYMTAYMLSNYEIKAVEEFSAEKESKRRTTSGR